MTLKYRIDVPKSVQSKYSRVWIPHEGPQTLALMCNEFEVLYGGARGGGKTDAGIIWITDGVENPRFRALVIRKNGNDLADWIDRASQWFVPMGAKKREIDNVPTFIWPSGAMIRLGHLKDAEAYTKYQGHEYHKILIEEATQIPDEKRYLQLIASCRSTVPGIKPQVFLTANPGNVGHAWIKARFIDVAPPNTRYSEILPNGVKTRIYIPSTVDDNPTIVENDPGYVDFLDSLKSRDENLWRAWRHGDWSIFVGQVFANFRPHTHVITKMPVPLKDCRKIVGFDWGYNAPGAAVFIAVLPKDKYGIQRYVQYREIYMNQKTPEQWAQMLADISEVETIDYMVLPHDCYYNNQGRSSVYEVFTDKVPKIRFTRANTLVKGARHARVANFQDLLLPDPDDPSVDQVPRYQILSRCTDTIRTIPLLMYDEHDIEDIDTDGEDHIFDALSTVLNNDREITGSRVIRTGDNSQKVERRKGFAVNAKGNIVVDDVISKTLKSLEKSERQGIY